LKSYILEDSREGTRLESQSLLDLYSPESEISHLVFKGTESILDAGCGSGLMGRYFKMKYPQISYMGGDQSLERLKSAEELNCHQFSFFKLDLFSMEDFKKIPVKYDTIFNRYVLHHLKNHQLIIQNFYEALPKSGRLIIVDFDGIFSNLGTNNTFLIECINKITSEFGGDVYVGRKLSTHLNLAGFKNISWKVQLMDFQGENRMAEVEQFKQRFEFGKENFVKILGSEITYHRFVKEYLAELSKPHVTMFYNKIIIEGWKL